MRPSRWLLYVSEWGGGHDVAVKVKGYLAGIFSEQLRGLGDATS